MRNAKHGHPDLLSVLGVCLMNGYLRQTLWLQRFSHDAADLFVMFVSQV